MDTLHVARRELKKFETAIQYFHYPTLYVDLEGDVLTYNQEFTQLMDLSNSDPKSVPIKFSDFIAIENRPSAIRHYERILLGAGDTISDQYPVLSASDEKIMVDIAGSLLEDSCGTQYGILFTLQPAKWNSEDWNEIAHYLYNVKHELKSPLNAIMGFAELLLKKPTYDRESREYMHYIYESGIHMLRIIESLTAANKPVKKHLDLQFEWFSLERVFSFIYYIGRMLIRRMGKDISLRGVYPNDVDLYVFGDRQRVTQILINLVQNAIKFTDTGEVEFGVEENEKEEYEFFVRDTGIGIPERIQSEVFLPYYRLEDDAVTEPEGQGMGLSITKKFVEDMGGEIFLYSAPYEGSEFYFTLPPYCTG